MYRPSHSRLVGLPALWKAGPQSDSQTNAEAETLGEGEEES